jgi:chromosome segregation ATPase
MVQPGAGLDTPRTNIGDATYLTNQPEFDISQEMSFQSPSKDNNNLIQQLQNGRRGAINLKTPRSRAPFGDRRNLPTFAGGGEFTPLLKSATRNSARKFGKENGVPRTPAFLKPGGLDDIVEDLSPVPNMGSSIYDDTRNGSYMNGTPLPAMDDSSSASTPMALLPRRNEGANVLQDANQLSLREQENVIDKIEKENFGLKLKIHFLEEALRKAGPGFSEAALKENTDLKVDKITMQKELQRYKKTLSNAEKDLEAYRQQLLEVQEKNKRRHGDEALQRELKLVQDALEDKELEVHDLRDKLQEAENLVAQSDKLRDDVGDLEADVREKDRLLDEREDEIENLKAQLEEHATKTSELEDSLKASKRREVELEELADSSEELEEARETIDELERDIKLLQTKLQEANEDRQEAISEKERATSDLEELQDEMANKSVTTNGLSRQIEEKANRLQDELEDLNEHHAYLKEQHGVKIREVEMLSEKLQALEQNSGEAEQKLRDELKAVYNEHSTISAELQSAKEELKRKGDEKELLQVRHDALTSESASLQKDLSKAQAEIEAIEDKLDQEKNAALGNERDVREQYKNELDRLNDEIEDLRADIREKERVFDDDSDKWESERRNLESQCDRAEEQAAGLKRTLDKLQEVETTLSGKESKLQEALQIENDRHTNEEAVLKRQIEELSSDLGTRRQALDEARSELSSVKEELRLSQREQKSLAEKVEALEDEIEVLQTSLDDESEQAMNDINAAKQESEGLRRQLHAVKLDLARAESATADARAEIETFQGDVQAGNGNREQLSSRLREVESQLAKVRKERQEFQDQVAHVTVELHSVQASAVDVEAERDELSSQLREMQQKGETHRVDQEKLELRTAKMRMDNEVRRLNDEVKLLTEQQEVLEKELQQEIHRSGDEEARLMNTIRDLQRKVSGTSSDRELTSAKRTIQQLEQRISELQLQIASGDDQNDAGAELTLLRRDLSSARQKETEYLQREAAQKDTLRTLKRQISELERKAHDAEVSRLEVPSPHSSAGGSVRKSELIEVRHQLATAHQSLKDLRSQVREAERESARKLSAMALDLDAKTIAWEEKKETMEEELDAATLAKDELLAKNALAEQTISRLRSKIAHLERELHNERKNSGEDRTIALERRDLHDMLRETQVRAEELEIELKSRDSAIKSISNKEMELRSQLKRVRDERSSQRERASTVMVELEALEHEYQVAAQSWEEERRRLNRGVRFTNTSVSEIRSNETLIRESEEREKRHVKELRGLAMQIEWLRARVRREEGLRADAAFAKKYLNMQIEMFSAW